jgi:hypothetical protein
MVQRFQERAKAVRTRNMPPVAGLERKAFVKQAELDFQDFAMIADSTISLDGGILTIDLRMEICDAAIRGIVPVERETQAAMENIARADSAREALIEDTDRPSMLRVVETIEPIDVNECPGSTLGVPAAVPAGPAGFSLTHGYLV